MGPLKDGGGGVLVTLIATAFSLHAQRGRCGHNRIVVRSIFCKLLMEVCSVNNLIVISKWVRKEIKAKRYKYVSL